LERHRCGEAYAIKFGNGAELNILFTGFVINEDP
tara:strand:+ start:1136 stop:1237 length:102 start_codon:yes stop_codon:yes gene_type:complete